MTDLRHAAKLALEEWRTAPGSVRMASLMMALERALADDTSQERVDKAEEQRHKSWCASLNQTLAVMPPRPAPCDCKTTLDVSGETGTSLNPVKWQQPDLATVGEMGVGGEPVAWRFYDGKMWCYVNHLTDLSELKFQPLYTRPQQCPNCVSLMEQNTELDKKLAEWVGLTEEDTKPMIQKALSYYGYRPEHWALASGAGFCELARAIEAKLKEKNRGV